MTEVKFPKPKVIKPDMRPKELVSTTSLATGTRITKGESLRRSGIPEEITTTTTTTTTTSTTTTSTTTTTTVSFLDSIITTHQTGNVVRVYDNFGGNLLDTLPGPGDSGELIYGLGVDDEGNLLVVDRVAGPTRTFIYKLDKDDFTTVLDSFEVTNFYRDVAWGDDGNLYSIEYWGPSAIGNFRKHDGFSDTILTTLAIADAPGDLGTSSVWWMLTTDGTNFYFSDVNDDRIYKTVGFSLTVDSFIATPAGTIYGVGWDRDTGDLLSLDQATGLIYRHDGFSTTILDTFTGGSYGLAKVKASYP